ncbi:MAG: hypothetical protein HY578_03525 [Nitrospinae bacterium]|nr:hypothetical protein [Nitrospinota bacterium]
MPEIIIDLSQLFSGNARLSELDNYIQKAKTLGPVCVYAQAGVMLSSLIIQFRSIEVFL